MKAYNWTCPYCNRPQSVTLSSTASGSFGFLMNSPDIGPIGLFGRAITCANPDCRKATVTVSVVEAIPYSHKIGMYVGDNPKRHLTVRLMPESSAKPQPDFIPLALREDYYEACRIRDLSPKAAATLARRCLQGMIRDFCGLTRPTLFAEINALKELVESDKAPSGVSLDSVEAIDHVRSVGNIGAHMEKDINHIIPVDPEEAQLLIELIESLFEEWYAAREKRASRFNGIKALAENKRNLIASQTPPQTDGSVQ